MDYLYYSFIVFVFLAVVLLLEGIYFMWVSYNGPSAVVLDTRLQAITSGLHRSTADDSIYKRHLLSDSPKMERLLMHVPFINRLDRLLLQSGLELSVVMYVVYSCMAFLGGLATALFFSLPVLIALPCAFIAGVLPLIIVLRSKTKRIGKIEEQLPEAIDMIARALKAGHAFSAALEMVATEGTDPIAGEFGTTFKEVNYGISMQEALMNLSDRVPSTDLRYMVIAIVIQRESGGNLAELLEKISSLIRDRFKLFGAIRVLSAEGRLSAWILGCLPFVMAAVLYLINTEYMSILYTDPLGIMMLYGSLAMMIIGIFIMSRIIKIRV
jgi:tight adherence protein B